MAGGNEENLEAMADDATVENQTQNLHKQYNLNQAIHIHVYFVKLFKFELEKEESYLNRNACAFINYTGMKTAQIVAH